MARFFTAAQFRKKALLSQGIYRKGTFGRGLSGVRNCVEQLGYVQIDTISVVERAHHHVLWSRVPGYRTEMLNELLLRKDIFEYWFHAAAFLPMSDYRYALTRMHAIKSGEKHWFTNTNRKLMAEISTRIRHEGPLMARDFADKSIRQNGWWEWKPAKQALEQLFMEGDLMVVDRQGFQKVYDLTERVLPDNIDLSLPDLSQQAKYLIDTVIRAHGFASLKSFTYLRKGKALRSEVKERVAAMVDEQALIESTLACGETVYCDPSMNSRKKLSDKVAILSPFDNCAIQRQRCQNIFDFDFQIECYVPAHKRQFGYFCLPLLYRDEFVGRVDCKADRKQQVLLVKSLHLHRAIGDGFYQQLAVALLEFKAFNQCLEIKFESKSAAVKLLAAQL